MRTFKVTLKNSKEKKELVKKITAFNFAAAASKAHRLRSSCGEDWYDWLITSITQIN